MSIWRRIRWVLIASAVFGTIGSRFAQSSEAARLSGASEPFVLIEEPGAPRKIEIKKPRPVGANNALHLSGEKQSTDPDGMESTIAWDLSPCLRAGDVCKQ